MAEKKNTAGTKTSAKSDSAESFKLKVLSVISKTVKVSKKGLKSAGQAISDFGDKSVLKIENSQIRARIEKKYAELGSYVYAALISKNPADISMKNADVKSIVSDIDRFFSQVSKNETSIKAVDKKRGKTSASSTAKKPAKKAEKSGTAAKKTAPAAKKTAVKKPAQTAQKAPVKK